MNDNTDVADTKYMYAVQGLYNIFRLCQQGMAMHNTCIFTPFIQDDLINL